MTQKQLQNIRERWNRYSENQIWSLEPFEVAQSAIAEVTELLSEIERLQKREQAILNAAQGNCMFCVNENFTCYAETNEQCEEFFRFDFERFGGDK